VSLFVLGLFRVSMLQLVPKMHEKMKQEEEEEEEEAAEAETETKELVAPGADSDLMACFRRF